MKKILFFAAVLSVAFTSCMNEEFIGDNSPTTSQGTPGAIGFSFDVPMPTRAGGEAAATALGNHFIVYGEKGEATTGAKYTADDATTNTHQLVFQNYVVKYTGNSAYTTTSNTKNWEYVGLTQTYGNNVSPKAGETQTIKYWDYSATNYVFTAVSAVEGEITSGDVTVTKIDEKTDGNKVYDKGYTVTLTAAATATKLYFSDRQVINQGIGTNRDADNAYGGNVKLTFRNATSQIRVGMYEDIPGYDVKIKKFYYVNDADPTFATMATEYTSNFAANVPNLKTGSATTLTVTYYNEGTRINQPKISVSGTAANYITLSGTGLAANVQLNTTAASPTYDNGGNFTTVFPQESNDKNLKLKIDYQLVNSVTGETIDVNGATAEISAEYLQWKPNFKYTYLFKINDNTNGSTGGNVVGLYPITFDAVEIVAEDGTAEYITTVSEPSITTFGVSAGKYVTGGSEYTASSDIYATIMDGSSVKGFTLGGSTGIATDGGVNVYHVTTPNASTFPITEASVAEALANPGSITNSVYTCTVTYTKVTDASTLAASTNYYKTDGTHEPGTAGYVATLAVENTDYTITPSKAITDGVDIYTVAVTSITPVTDPTTLAAGTTYYKKDTNTKAPDATGYIPTIAVEGTDYEVAPLIKAIVINTETTPYFTAAPSEVTTVPGEDGIDITGTHALKLTGVAATTTTTAYAIEYIKVPDAFTTDGGKTYATSAEFTAAGTLYKEATCENVADATYYASNTGATYYKKIINMPGTKVYKVIRVN